MCDSTTSFIPTSCRDNARQDTSCQTYSNRTLGWHNVRTGSNPPRLRWRRAAYSPGLRLSGQFFSPQAEVLRERNNEKCDGGGHHPAPLMEPIFHEEIWNYSIETS